MATGSTGWLAPLRDAYLRPWEAAEAWRGRTGGRVVGVLGWSVPRELIVAAGMLPVRLSPLRLSPSGDEWRDAVPAGLAAELSSATSRVLGGLLGGALHWIDGLVIGRDTEAYTKLFYVLREHLRAGDGDGLPPVAFYDLLRLPHRTSARYDRLRARELLEILRGWSDTPADLPGAVHDAAATATALRRVAELRGVSVLGREALIAAGGAQVLPGPEAREALAAAPEDPAADGGAADGGGVDGGGVDGGGVDGGTPDPAAPAGRPGRVFVTGSGIDDPSVYEAVEATGMSVVGEDHEWGDDGLAPPAGTPDPIDGIVDRYHLSLRGAARSGLHDRVRHTADRVRATGADAVLQVVFGHDEAPGWEVPELRARLGDSVPVVSVALEYGAPVAGALDTAVAQLTAAVSRG